jgi:hypothetical protein
MGKSSLYNNTTGSKNTGIGYGAGDAITTGSNNTIIGEISGTTTLSDTVIIAAGSTERLKVNATGLYVNGTLHSSGGNSTTEGLYEMANTISANYSITSGNNALTAGPITINTGISVTIPTGSTWVIA